MFSLGLSTLYPNLLCSQSCLGLAVDLEAQQLEAPSELEAEFCHHCEADFDFWLEADCLQLEAAFFQVDFEHHFLEVAFDHQHLEAKQLLLVNFDHQYLEAAFSWPAAMEAALEVAFCTNLEAALEFGLWPHLDVVFSAVEAVWQLGPVAITVGMAAAEVDFEIEVAEGSLLMWLCSACSKLCLLQIQVLPTLWQW